MKVALVTGGTRGIGEAVAKKLKKSGYTVVINYFSSEDKANELQIEGFFTYRADVGDEGSVKEMFDYVEKRFGGVDVLINNAGIALKQSLLIDVSAEQFDRLFATDVRGVFLCAKAAIRAMLKKGSGDIVNLSSIWGVEGASCEVAYSMAKGAVNAFTKSLAKELEFSDICVQAIAPSMVATDMNAHLTENDVKDFCSERGMEKPLTSEQIAEFVLKTLSFRKNGAIYVLDGKDRSFVL
ncbi:MAG: SDR family NAD(P)-dependent oxidoreductase [Clostridia bacterium]|nr:SDR family NAD(P)-dependent oxidoreductase [Clostridia bacterium]